MGKFFNDFIQIESHKNATKPHYNHRQFFDVIFSLSLPPNLLSGLVHFETGQKEQYHWPKHTSSKVQHILNVVLQSQTHNTNDYQHNNCQCYSLFGHLHWVYLWEEYFQDVGPYHNYVHWKCSNVQKHIKWHNVVNEFWLRICIEIEVVVLVFVWAEIHTKCQSGCDGNDQKCKAWNQECCFDEEACISCVLDLTSNSR